jgi:hypothetical protein
MPRMSTASYSMGAQNTFLGSRGSWVRGLPIFIGCQDLNLTAIFSYSLCMVRHPITNSLTYKNDKFSMQLILYWCYSPMSDFKKIPSLEYDYYGNSTPYDLTVSFQLSISLSHVHFCLWKYLNFRIKDLTQTSETLENFWKLLRV